MSVIRLHAGQACQKCGATVDLPHRTQRDCAAAVKKEIRASLKRPGEAVAGRKQRTAG